MREIKFRAWHIILKKYISVDAIDFSGGTIRKGDPCIVDDIENGGCYLLSNCVLEQYTDLKDKNGKEIYFLSDIVRAVITDELTGEVTFLDGVLYLCLKTYRIVMRGNEAFNLIFAEELEIIENIHSA